MTTTIRLPIQKLTAATVRALKARYPEAEISVEISSERPKTAFGEAEFWAIIDALDWSKTGDDAAIVAPALKKLAAKPLRSIYVFADLLAEKLFLLDSRAHAAAIGEGAWAEGSFFSADHFLYARCCAVANGRDFFEKALNTPAKMPKDLTFEALLHLPSAAFEAKTGRAWEYQNAHGVETFSNEMGWKKTD